jgi:type IV pilus assembly protein PilX
MNALHHHFDQRGSALIVGLLLLIVLVVIGIAAVGNVSLQTRMSYGLGQSNLAFQAAETGLTSAETWLQRQVVQPIPCETDCASADPVWARPVDPLVDPLDFEWATLGRTYGFDYSAGDPVAIDGRVVPGIVEPPYYVIEEVGADLTGSLRQGIGRTYRPFYYQVSAQGLGAQDDTRAVVQSVYIKPY